ncbi:MAG: ferritin-like domain-containing protein [Gemmatimonas sp.]
MADSETLHDLFVDELKDAYDAEKQLIKALRKMSKSASHPDLADAFASHLEETNGQVSMLEEVFALLDLRPRGKHCPGIAGIIEEGNEAIEEHEKSPLLDAALVGGGKRAEHYEIAAYTTLIAMANELGYDEAAEKLDEILQQEIACDAKLDELAAQLLPLANQSEDEEDDEGDGDDESDEESDDEQPSRRTARKAPATKRTAGKSAAKKSAAKKKSR